jgi:hypothetical protein
LTIFKTSAGVFAIAELLYFCWNGWFLVNGDFSSIAPLLTLCFLRPGVRYP